jgi:hypothetical protein
MTHKERKNKEIFCFAIDGCSLLSAEGFSCSLDVLHEGLGINKIASFDQKMVFSNCKISQVLFS